MPCSDFHEIGKTEIGKRAILEIRNLGKEIGCRYSDLVLGDNKALSLDLLIARIGWQHDSEQYEKNKAETEQKAAIDKWRNSADKWKIPD